MCFCLGSLSKTDYLCAGLQKLLYNNDRYEKTIDSGFDGDKRFGFAVIPGVDYAITDRIGIEATLGALNWDHSNYKSNTKQNAWLFNASTGLTLGLYFYL